MTVPSVASLSPRDVLRTRLRPAAPAGTRRSAPSLSTTACFAPRSRSVRITSPDRPLARASQVAAEDDKSRHHAATSKYVSASRPATRTTADHGPGREGSERDQRVHRRREMPRVPERHAVEAEAGVEDDGSGQGERDPLPIRELQGRHHGQESDGDGEDDCDRQPSGQHVQRIVVMVVPAVPPGRGARLRRAPGALRTLPRRRPRRALRPRPRGRGGRLPAPWRSSLLPDAVEPVQLLLDPRRTGGAGSSPSRSRRKLVWCSAVAIVVGLYPVGVLSTVSADGAKRTSRASASAATKPRSRRPSAASAAVARFVRRPDVVDDERRAAARSRSRRQRPADEAVVEHGAVRPGRQGRAQSCSALVGQTNRLRSACESSTLSYSGRKRGGAGVSGSGRGASGRSKSSRPRSSRKARSRGRSRSTTSRSPVRRDQAATSATRRRPERGEVAQHDVVERRRRRPSGRPSHASAVVDVDLRGPAPDAARRHLHAARAGCGRRRRARPRRGRGNRSAERGAQLGAGARPLGEQSSARTPAPASRSTPASAGAVLADAGRARASSTGCISGRSSRQSSALTRWIVARMTTMRTTLPLDEQLGELLGPEPLEPRPERRVRVQRHLRLQPDEVLDRVERRQVAAAAAAAGARASPGSARGGPTVPRARVDSRGCCFSREAAAPSGPGRGRAARPA